MAFKWVSSASKRRRHFSDYIIYFSIAAIFGYTIAALTLQFRGLPELSPTLTTCWYGFWTVEIVALSAIKISKVKTISKEGENVKTD